jgi:hypothetical protein
MNTKTKLFLAILGLTLVCGSAWIHQSNSSPHISLSVESLPEIIRSGDRAKIVLKAEANGAALRHGEVLLDFLPLDQKASALPVLPPRLAGNTDGQGLFISGWQPSCPGRFMIRAEVSKSGHASGRKVCFVVVTQSELREGRNPPAEIQASVLTSGRLSVGENVW